MSVLCAEVTRRGEKTEIGAMADALQVFKDALIAKKAADEAAAADAPALQPVEKRRFVEHALAFEARRIFREDAVGIDGDVAEGIQPEIHVVSPQVPQ